MSALFAVAAGAAFLIWPALLNGYPLVFSDTGGLVEMGHEPYIGWDKPFVYGPFLVLSLFQSLFLPMAVQALLMSWAIWLTTKVLGQARAGLHLIVMIVLAVGSAAPWFASLLMPDAFTAVVPLCLFVLAFGRDRLSRAEIAGVMLLATVAIGSHLSHLVLAAGCLVVLLMLCGWRVWRPTVPLVAALLGLVAINAVGHGKLAVSPYGAVFAFARLVGDGPGRAYLDRACPDPALRICRWQGRLSSDSDEFLWDPNGPVWAGSFGPIAFAPEAARLVPAVIAAYPLEVLRAAAANTVRQLGMVRVGDVLGDDHLSVAVLPRLVPYFPASEIARYQAALQTQGLFRQAAAPFHPLHLALLLAGTAGTVWVLLRWRRDPALAGFAAVVLVALLANAFATGALSAPHDRYQARIAWLVLLAPLLYAARVSWADTSAGDMRTRPL